MKNERSDNLLANTKAAPGRLGHAAHQNAPARPGRIVLFLFVCFFFAASLFFPLAGLFGMSTARPDDAGTFPDRFDLGALESWFSRNYPLRSGAISVYHKLLADWFRTSGSDQVVAGRQGWLFFAEALPAAGDQETAARIAATVSLLQRSFAQRGAAFVFMPVPNKSSIYPEYLPPAYEEEAPSLYDLVLARLDDTEAGPNSGVALDLKSFFLDAKAQYGDRLYRVEDSHWTDFGAQLAAGLVFGEKAAAAAELGVRRETGDLYRMLFPAFGGREDVAVAAEGDADFRVDDPLFSVDDVTIRTYGQGTETMLVFRDSFGRALIGPLAARSRTALFSREIPYRDDLSPDGSRPDLVILEIAERRLPDLVREAPLVEAPQIDFAEADALIRAGADVKTAASLGIRASVKQQGAVFFPLPLGGISRVLVAVDDIWYEAFLVAGEEEGFSLFLPGRSQDKAALERLDILIVPAVGQEG